MTVDITNLVVANVLVTLTIVFFMYRNSIINNNRLEKTFEQVYQENRNTIQYMNDTVEKLQRQMDNNHSELNRNLSSEVDDLYRRMDDMYSELNRRTINNKNNENSEIPF